jgi:hypothetical protein
VDADPIVMRFEDALRLQNQTKGESSSRNPTLGNLANPSIRINCLRQFRHDYLAQLFPVDLGSEGSRSTQRDRLDTQEVTQENVGRIQRPARSIIVVVGPPDCSGAPARSSVAFYGFELHCRLWSLNLHDHRDAVRAPTLRQPSQLLIADLIHQEARVTVQMSRHDH